MRAELEKFHPLKYKGNLKQVSWDLYEEIEEILDNDETFLSPAGSIRYKITTMLEICDPMLDDYKWLKGMLEIVDMEMEKVR